MTTEMLTYEEKAYLLALARRAIDAAVCGNPPERIDLESLSPLLRQDGAAFVTLTKHGDLRGCIGAIQAYQPLVLDVREHAAAAAMDDYRFPQVRPEEVNSLEIEISRLTIPKALEYGDPLALPNLIRPNVDGVVLIDGSRRSTFLPQVWEKIPEADQFLNQLCLKMGAPAGLWRRKVLTVLLYQVEEFREGQER